MADETVAPGGTISVFERVTAGAEPRMGRTWLTLLALAAAGSMIALTLAGLRIMSVAHTPAYPRFSYGISEHRREAYIAILAVVALIAPACMATVGAGLRRAAFPARHWLFATGLVGTVVSCTAIAFLIV